MAFSKREKNLLAATLAVLCVLSLDLYVLTPLLDRRAEARARRENLTVKTAHAGSLLQRSRLLGRTWRRMLAQGMKSDPAATESQILRSLRNWSADVGLRLSSLRPERSTEATELPEITVHLAGTGTMAAVSRLLLRIEEAKIPARIKMLQIGSRKDGTDDLSLHLKVSTLYCPATPMPPAKARKRPGANRGQR